MASDVYTKLTCTYCLDDIIGVRVKCVDCKDIDLCLQCFSAGAEIGQHLNSHSYKFIDSTTIRNKSKWSNKEELLLLNGIQHYGLGNWENIAEHIKTRTAEEARDEYISRYVDGNIGRATWSEAYEKRAKLPDLSKDEPSPSTAVIHTVPPLDINLREANDLGYMPHRDDFECEYDNDAESLVSSRNMSRNDDDEMDMALKLAQVDMYREKLKERARRKRVCRDYQLVSQFFAVRKERARHRNNYHPADHDLEEKMRYPCQFLTAQEHACIVNNIKRQRDLEKRLSELLRYRKHGLTKMEEIPHFEQEAAVKAKSSGSSTPNCQSITLKRKRDENDADEVYSIIRNSIYPTDNHISLPELERWPLQQPQPPPPPLTQIPSLQTRLLQLQRTGIIHPHIIDAGLHLLSESEKKLCSTLEITATKFISLKTLMLANPEREAENEAEERIKDYVRTNVWTLMQS